jgi:hypothetical protein
VQRKLVNTEWRCTLSERLTVRSRAERHKKPRTSKTSLRTRMLRSTNSYMVVICKHGID